MDFQPTTKNSAQINAEVESFLSTYHPSLSIPVPIEDIIEIALKIDIIPIPGLKSAAESACLDIDAFIGCDFKSISIDAQIYRNVPNRCRFSLAHEIGHMFLHGYLYNKLQFCNTDEWVKLLNEMPLYERNIVECQANEFAGLVLVPREFLKKELDRVIGENKERFRSSLSQQRVLTKEEEITLAIYPLSHYFEVSEKVTETRLQRDGLLIT